MPSVLGLGDNTIDIYVDRGQQYPGGNALNFAVYAKRLGADAHYMGCVGDDGYGSQIVDALTAEGVAFPRLRKTASETSWSRVRHTQGDRWFDGSHLYSAEEYRLNVRDDDYLQQFDVVHLGVDSMLDQKIDQIASASRRLSYDFSDKYTPSSFGTIAPLLEVAVLSQANGGPDDAVALAMSVANLGTPVVIVTRGMKGAICLAHGTPHEQGIVETDVTDTLGAGDAFTAAFILALLKDTDIPTALADAASFAALICREEGAFGHGMPMKPNVKRNPEHHPIKG